METRRTVGARVGGRSERVVASVLEAALAELAQKGYEAFRLEDVATRAGVAKTTIYRRWPAKVDLVGAALLSLSNIDEPLPSSGSLRKDLLFMVEQSVRKLATDQGKALARLITTELAADKDLENHVKRLKEEVRSYRASLIRLAQDRGEISKAADPYLVMDAIWAPIMLRVLRFGEPYDRKSCVKLIDLVVTGAENL